MNSFTFIVFLTHEKGTCRLVEYFVKTFVINEEIKSVYES
jgi:hypothetical protein